MKTSSTALKAVTGIAALAISVTACGSSSNGKTNADAAHQSMAAAPSTSSSSTTDTTATAAAGLRAGLDQLFREHVNLTGFAVATAVNSGITSPNTAQALSALDDNTVALGDAIGSVYGATARTAFLKMWRAHIGFFVNYTKGLATNDQKLVASAQAKLANYKKDFADFLGTATGLPATAVAQDLQGHITTLEAAIQAIVSKSPTAADKISMAESHMAGTAAVLAKAIAAQKKLS